MLLTGNVSIEPWCTRAAAVGLPVPLEIVERGSSVVECRTRNRVSPGSNPPLLPFQRLGIFVLSTVVPVDSAV